MANNYTLKIVSHNTLGLHIEYLEFRILNLLKTLPDHSTRQWKIVLNKSPKTKAVTTIKASSVLQSTGKTYSTDGIVDCIRNTMRDIGWQSATAEFRYPD